ncbi:MAG: right-handed parallel beta-helix repeat-containing protein [Haliscomenobacter sp.]|uniref:right-handed parallel beta-helix repeat-containing protein n=1 Tax=Haliscomenobacter sp. TaxID=2717303 RepID=UPI0029A0BB17|nr:right-handed parallel beta-helix repeat-containing protein [Haliscomenobacter sp.]MDX2072278.1 right-handed parallel beta-helix repeat-containing protein [Haliscomenobacter sp.]
MKQFTLLTLLILSSALNSFATNYYFSSQTGDDSRSPQQARNAQTPWKTIAKLNAFFSQLQPGDSVLFKRGEVFSGGIQIVKSGSTSLPIVLAAYGSGAAPVINGFTNISTWTSVGGGIYESPVINTPGNVNMVAINNTSYAMGRYPNADASNKGFLTFEGHGNLHIIDNQLPASPTWNNGELVVRTSRWTIERVPITTTTKSRINYSKDTDYDLEDGYGYFIQNHIKTLDQFGEWYYNPSTKKLNVFFGTKSPTSYNVQIATTNTLIESKANDIVIANLVIKGANQYGVYSNAANLKNLRIKNTKILFSGIDAIRVFNCSNFVLENSEITNSNSIAVNLKYDASNAVLTNNKIRNTGIFPGMITENQAYGIISYTKGFKAEYNHIVKTGYVGIRFAGDNNLIKNNYIDTFCLVIDDGSGIYTWTGKANTTFSNRSVIGNIVLNGLGAPEGTNRSDYAAAEGIYLDDNATNVDVIGNTVAHCVNNGIYIHNARNIKIQNNTLYNNKVQIKTVHDDLGSPITNAVFTANHFFSKSTDQTTFYFKSDVNDFAKMGSFSGNYYSRPFDENLTIMANYDQPGVGNVEKMYDVRGPMLPYGKNLDGGGGSMRYRPYNLVSIDNSRNKYNNPGFENTSMGVSCWSPKGDCATTWSANSVLDKRAVKISGKSQGVVALNCGAIDKNKQYILRFSAVAERETQIEVYLRHSTSPWSPISSSKKIYLSPNRTEYEVLFSFPSSVSAGHLIFQAFNENFSYWLDNVGLFEASAVNVKADEIIRFEYNPTTSDKTILLPTSYMDVKNTIYTNKVVLKPYTSVVLMKKDGNLSNSSGSVKGFNAQIDECRVLLNWAWNLDDNFDHFELEESKDGVSFAPIAKINSNGKTGFQSYQFLDAEIQNVNYYRLRYVYKDGNSSYSEILEEKTNCEAGDWQIYPNLLNGGNAELTVKLFTRQSSVIFTIIDQFGRKIKSFQTETTSGWNTIRWNLPNLSTGMYYLQHSGELLNKALPFVVSRN